MSKARKQKPELYFQQAHGYRNLEAQEKLGWQIYILE